MANIGDLVVSIDANTSGLESGLTRAQRATQQFSQSARRGATGFARIARESQRAVPPISNLTGLLGTLTGLLGAREVMQYADAWQNAGNQLRQVTDTSSQLAATQEALMRVANETRSDFTSTANLYSRLARSTTELGLSQQDLIGLTQTINQSFAVSGASAEEASAAITQLSQGLAAGALRGDEFNSVSEQAPGIMRAIAESLDMTIGELREFAAEGGITAEIVVDALQGASDTIENDFGKAVATFGQNMTVARNNLREWIGTSGTVASALDSLGESLITISENMDAVVQVGGVFASLVAGRIIGRIAAMSGGLTTAAGAAAALRGALAFLGGPIGILVGAGGLLFTFREELGLVAPEAATVAEELDEITRSLDGMGDALLDVQVAAFGAELVQIELQAERLQTRIESLQQAANDPASFGQGQRGDISAGIDQAQSELSSLESRQEAINQAMAGLERFRASADNAAGGANNLGDGVGELSSIISSEAIEAAVKLAESTNNAASALDEFSARLTPEVEDILERAGPGATIDAEGQIRDAWGNTLPTLQRQLDDELQGQVNAFSAEQNLMKGLEEAAKRFTDEAETAAKQAFGSIQPASQNAVREAMNEAKNIGSLTFKLESADGTSETDVEGDADDLRRLANLFSGVASAV